MLKIYFKELLFDLAMMFILAIVLICIKAIYDCAVSGHLYLVVYGKLFVNNMIGCAVFFALLEFISVIRKNRKSK